jgi:hypothetical protein
MFKGATKHIFKPYTTFDKSGWLERYTTAQNSLLSKHHDNDDKSYPKSREEVIIVQLLKSSKQRKN